MKKVLYGILSGCFRLLARLPWTVLYALADVIYFILYYIVRYRRAVVRENLQTCFPDIPEKDRDRIARKFYRNFADNIVETIKLLHISDEEMLERMRFENNEVVERVLRQGRSIIFYFSHCFNWEWATSFSLHIPSLNSNVHLGQIYRPLRNRWFDSLMLSLRQRFNTECIPKKTTLRTLIRYHRDGVLTGIGFMSDQKPSHGDPTYVTTLLGRPTAMITGTETLGRRLGMAAIYWDMEKISRGHYRISSRLIADNIADTPEMAVTEAYTRMLEETVRRTPDIWLWTHRRWKNPVTLPQSLTSEAIDK